MAATTAIEWTDATWNPIRARNKANGKVGWHCVHVSEGCRNCYAEKINLRLGTGLPYKPGHEKDIDIFLQESILLAPLKWREPRRIFLTSMSDVAGDFITDDMLDRMFAVMALCQQHTFQVLCKRPERMRAYMADLEREAKWMNAVADIFEIAPAFLDRCYPVIGQREPWLPLPNVWLGTSAENQATADERIPHLLATPAAIRLISGEPLLGQMNLRAYLRNGWRLPKRSWADFSWPGWVPQGIRAEIESFWQAGYGRGPDDWLRGAIDNGQPPLGTEGQFRLCRTGEPLVSGRFVPAWNNIGRVVDAAGNTHVVSAGGYQPRQPFLDWVISGYESGPAARPRPLSIARSLRDQCATTGTAFFHKQNGEYLENAPGVHPLIGGNVPGSNSLVRIVAFKDGTSANRVGKKAAGNHLDGRQHLKFPHPEPVEGPR